MKTKYKMKQYMYLLGFTGTLVGTMFAMSIPAYAVGGTATLPGVQYFAGPEDREDPPGGLSTGDVDVDSNPIMIRLQQIVNFLTIGVGIVITLSVVFAGFQYITSRGDPSKTKAAIERLWNAGIAIFLYVFMYIIISWLIPGR